MKGEFLEKDDHSVTFVLKGTNATTLNTLRRLIVDEVPTLAIEEVEISKNSSVLYDEVLAHRLGLTTLKTDIKSYNPTDKCKCEGKKENCPKCQLVFNTLKAKGPKTVYAEELTSKDPKVVPVFGKTPIVKLLKNQAIELSGLAMMKRGKDHIKHSPGILYYRGYPMIKIGPIKNVKEVVESCPTKVFEEKGGKLSIKDEKKCILCNACVAEVDGTLEVKGNDQDFIVTVESWGQLTPAEMLQQAIAELDTKLVDLDKATKTIK